ncbi:uncharacterized protein LOC110843502 isoform X2 [Folsomia candida]|uniref:uncharacterized protein LOC110843502 isoform X2 n=1 Tax=Folsomia candida TaxID=158441 RepID=UPI0016053A59|nr:uncharacterized protein LOC110843502 isoform X2 [Folsomia candida]
MMPTCKMNETKLEVNENYEEADLSDVEDDVFVRSGGRNGYRVEYDIAKKPLMTPRKKVYGFDNMKNGGLHTEVRSAPQSLRVICMPMCYILISTFAFLGLITVITFLTNYVSWPLSIVNIWKKGHGSSGSQQFVPCDNFEVTDVWVQQFPKLLTESAFRLVDVNGDGVDDIIFGYATGADGYGIPDFVCDIYFNGQMPCFGGVLSLDGVDGKELWRHWTAHEVFALNCNEDINLDRIPDCLVGGRAGVFCAISGSDGTLLWSFDAKNALMNIYTSQFIRDLNGDGVQEVLAVQGGDPLAEPGSTNRLSGRIMIVSGKTGEVLQAVGTPDQKESYYSPQILTYPDGTDYVLFGTGGETHGGGLYLLSLAELYKGSTENAKLLYQDDQKGIMVPPVIADINGDSVADIIMAMFNSSVIAFDGNSFNQIWNYSFPSSETYTTLTPGYFNDDTVLDFLVKYQFGPGFPVYYYAKTTVLDGITGSPILEKPIIDTIGSQASTPLIRCEGFGNDIFLYWSSNCKGFESNSSQFAFVKGTTVHEQSRADFCKLRFNSKLINQLRAFNHGTGLPGSVIYDSELRTALEYNNTVDTSADGQNYLRMHPEMWQYLDQRYSNVKPQSVDTSDIIPRYPASALMPPGMDTRGGGNLGGQSSLGQYVPSYPGGSAVYELPSQPELSESIKYPTYHSVHKHGKYPIPQSVLGSEVAGGGGMSNGNGQAEERRGESNGNVNMWPSYYNKLAPGMDEGEKYPAVFPYSKSTLGHLRYLPQSSDGESAAEMNRERNEDMANVLGAGGEDQAMLNQYLQHPQSRWKRDEAREDRVRTASARQKFDELRKRVLSKRHIGPHDMDGIQRLISTGTLAQPVNGEGIDLIFATYWFFPAKPQAILPKDQECIQEKLSKETERFDERSKYYGMDHDQYEDTITNECLQQQDDQHQQQPPSSSSSDGVDENDEGSSSQTAEGQRTSGSGTYESQSSYNPFDVQMGQMTVYRVHITCSCSEFNNKKSSDEKGSHKNEKKCASILPMKDQPWSGYMGSHADSHLLKKVNIMPTSQTTSSPITPTKSVP